MTTQARPLHLLGRRQLDALGARIQQALPPLARNWWRQENRIQLVGVSTWTEELRSSSLRYVLRDGEGRWLALLGTEQAWLKLAESWLGCEVPVEGPLIRTLRHEFCLALYRQMVGPEATAVVLEPAGWSEIPPSSLKVGGGALVIELDVDGIPLTVLAPVGLWPEFASWPVSRPAPVLQQAAAALADTSLAIEVRLHSVRVPMTDMGSLAAGDFLNLGHDLSGRVRVMNEGSQIDLSAVLGQHDGHRAVRIESHHGPQQ